MKKITLIAAFSALALGGYAQTADDALNMSLTRTFGTARVLGAGGAFGALGGDLGAVSINPAGVGVFRNNYFTGGLGLNFVNSNTDFLNQNSSELRFHPSLGNFGFVSTKDVRKKFREDSKNDWNFVNFSITHNRRQNYQANSLFQGRNSESSLLDFFAQDATRSTDSLQNSRLNTLTSLAYEAFLINPDSTFGDFFDVIPYGSMVRQSELIMRRGNVSETAFNIGANYGNVFYIGAGVGLNRLNYRNTINYKESIEASNLSDFNNFDLTESFDIRGTGVNVRVGTIVTPTDWLRFGVSYESNTFYSVNDIYTATMNSSLNGPNGLENYSITANNLYDYSLRTPGKVTGSFAILFEDKGFLSADYERVDYSKMQFVMPDRDFSSDLNADISNLYRAVNNFRFGGEYKLNTLAFRAGVAFWDSPYKEGINSRGGDMSQTDFSLGFGIKGKGSFLDISGVLSTFSFYRSQYQLSEIPWDAPADFSSFEVGGVSKISRIGIMLTYGVRL